MVHLVRLTLGAKLPRHGETYQRSCSYARTSWKRWLGMKKAVKTSSIVEHHLESWASCHRRTLVERPIRVPKHCQKVKASSCITSQQAQCGEMQPQCEKGQRQEPPSSTSTAPLPHQQQRAIAQHCQNGNMPHWGSRKAMGPCTHTTHSVRTVCQGIIRFLPGRRLGFQCFKEPQWMKAVKVEPFSVKRARSRSRLMIVGAQRASTRQTTFWLASPLWGSRVCAHLFWHQAQFWQALPERDLGHPRHPKEVGAHYHFFFKDGLRPIINYIFQSSRSSLGFAGNFNLSHATSEPFLLSFSLMSH